MGQRAPMVMGHSAYASSKGAMVAFSQVAAFELVAHNITVNSVLPGGVYTPGAANARGPAPNGPARSRQPPLSGALYEGSTSPSGRGAPTRTRRASSP